MADQNMNPFPLNIVATLQSHPSGDTNDTRKSLLHPLVMLKNFLKQGAQQVLYNNILKEKRPTPYWFS